MLRLSHAHLCSEHFAEYDFVHFMAEYQWGLLQSGICRAVHRVTDFEKKSSSNLQGWSWRAASAHHDTRWEIHWYPERSANKAKTKSLTRMPTAEKPWKKETVHKCRWQRKKEQTTNACGKAKERPNHKCWWQTKNGCPNQASKQLKPPQNPNGRLPASIRWRGGKNKHKKHTQKQTNKNKSQQSNRLLSATKEWTTTIIRAQSKNNCANDKHWDGKQN